MSWGDRRVLAGRSQRWSQAISNLATPSSSSLRHVVVVNAERTQPVHDLFGVRIIGAHRVGRNDLVTGDFWHGGVDQLGATTSTT